MATIDQQFVEYIVKTLVNNPDKVSVERKIDEKGVLLSLTVDPEDVGRVIGRRGVTAQAIRLLLRALGTKQDARYNLKIVNTDDENGATEHGREAKTEEATAEVRTEETGEDKAASEEELQDTESVAESDDEEVDEDEDEQESAEASELAEKTRAELADLDDLDI